MGGINMEQLSVDKLEKIATFINGDGFKSMEHDWKVLCEGYNKLSRITGNVFTDGIEVGTVYGMKLFLKRINEIRTEIELMEKERNK
jgi:hypothetical protein